MEDHYLIVDDRERAFIEILKDAESASSSSSFAAPWWRVQRLTYGDYALQINNSHTIAIFERKTYSDFAQSIKDDRIANFSGLIALREQNPGLRLALILEGRRPMDEEDRIEGIPFKCIRAKANHLWMRDGFQIIETSSTTDTVQRLAELTHDTISLLQVRGSRGGSASAAPAAEPCASARACLAAQPPQQLSTQDYVYMMYKEFPGIGSKHAAWIMCEHVIIAQFVTATDHHNARINKLSEQYRNQRDNDLDCRILSALPGISFEIARAMLHSE
jgi:ERCC4-type nuclease